MYKPIGNFPRGLYPLFQRNAGYTFLLNFSGKNPASQTGGIVCVAVITLAFQNENVLLQLTLVSRFTLTSRVRR